MSYTRIYWSNSLWFGIEAGLVFLTVMLLRRSIRGCRIRDESNGADIGWQSPLISHHYWEEKRTVYFILQMFVGWMLKKWSFTRRRFCSLHWGFLDYLNFSWLTDWPAQHYPTAKASFCDNLNFKTICPKPQCVSRFAALYNYEKINQLLLTQLMRVGLKLGCIKKATAMVFMIKVPTRNWSFILLVERTSCDW